MASSLRGCIYVKGSMAIFVQRFAALEPSYYVRNCSQSSLETIYPIYYICFFLHYTLTSKICQVFSVSSRTTNQGANSRCCSISILCGRFLSIHISQSQQVQFLIFLIHFYYLHFYMLIYLYICYYSQLYLITIQTLGYSFLENKSPRENS